jgi:hypothetical protein
VTQPKHTPGPWFALEGDTFNPERPWGVSRYLTLDECREIDGEDALPNTRTEVIAEVMPGEPGVAEADARLIAAAPALAEALRECVFQFEHLYAAGGSDAEVLDNAFAALKAAGSEYGGI